MTNTFRKFRSYFTMAVAVVSVGFLTSCGDDDEPNPKATITFDPSTETVERAPGEDITMKAVVTSQDRLKEFKMTKSILGVTKDTIVTNFPSAGYEFNLVDQVPASAQVGNSITYTFTATTNKGEVTTRTFTVNVVSTLNNYTAVILGNQNASAGSFYSTSDNQVITTANAPANAGKIDLVYYYSVGGPAATDLATIAAPSDPTAQAVHTTINSWTVKNATKFKKGFTDAQFTGLSSGQAIAAAYTGSSATESSKAPALQQGNVFGFVTAAGKYGMAKVESITVPTAANNNRSEIRLQIKVQR
ncbi:MAG: DUF4466 family protein [Hymenobacteraceae bacterium]|nr:DUF4466 family protein [Hymenobacteraceae bacterium]MDX5394623.1 DUF4466 family protein [Hymenobacteraceae bacterium]MDX5443428.1 DUF4466 family protein [Hymenobacteraceae bacterium]MDX5510654.1 DUF4466 family protein [Hymenobacteraceae bacterium]